jgi:hypothetical protein
MLVSADVTPERLRIIAGKTRQLLLDQGIPVQILTVLILIPGEYYEQIKANFPDQHPTDRAVSASERNWSIVLNYSPVQAAGLAENLEGSIIPALPDADTTPEKLKAINFSVWRLLANEQIPLLKLDINMLVKKNFYETIKENFPNRHPIDMVVNAGAENWTMQIQYSPYEQP